LKPLDAPRFTSTKRRAATTINPRSHHHQSAPANILECGSKLPLFPSQIMAARSRA
jgi:hypothetical protein